MAVKVSLTGRVSIETDGVVVDEGRFPGRQGRLLLAYLLAADGRLVPRDELADALWQDKPPASWEKALSVLVSKIRAVLNEAGVDGPAALTSAYGGYQLRLPPGTWVDVVAADESAAAAEHALTAGDLTEAVAEASTAASLARRTVLPGEDGPWVSTTRAQLHDVLTRALDCLAEAARRAGDAAAAVRAAEELTAVEPFRERGYRLLMEAQAAAGNGAEALRTYERCRTLLAEELGAYPSAETEAVYRELLHAPAKPAPGDPGPGPDAAPAAGPARRSRKALLAAAVTAILAGGVAFAALGFLGGGNAPPRVLPTSVVRIDPKTLKPVQVIRIGPLADIVVAAGGYVWATHGVLRYTHTHVLRNAGDRTLTRTDPATGETRGVGGGLAPCGLTADPSGDVWVANCYTVGKVATVVRVDAKTLDFKQTVRVPADTDYFRGLVYGGGSLWVGDSRGISKVDTTGEASRSTGEASRSIPLARSPGNMAWSDGYDDLWMTNFSDGSVARLDATTGDVKTYELGIFSPGALAIEGDSVWVGNWDAPDVVRLPAAGTGRRVDFRLPVSANPAGVTRLAAGAGAIWATVPDDHALWRIDPATGRTTRIGLRYYPWGVTTADGAVWVTIRAHDAPA